MCARYRRMASTFRPAATAREISAGSGWCMPGGAGPATTFPQVSSAAACSPDKFYIENGTIKLCPDTCTLVQKDDKAKIDVVFGCGGKIN